MARTLAQQLDAVDSAITKIEDGAQSITHEGRTYTRAMLATLYAERRRLETKAVQADKVTRSVAEF